MIELRFEADIRCPASRIFDTIIDFGGQDRWLGRSSAFRGTIVESPGLVALGTRYREAGPFGVRHGEVTEFEPPVKITFHQPMTMRLRAGTVDVTVRYTLTPGTDATHVTRVVTMGIPGPLRALTPVLVRAFRAESGRTLHALKAHADAEAAGSRS